MRWEKLEIPGDGGPGKRWGHTCNAIDGGKRFYVFGGYGKNNCQTNEVHVFDTVTRTWTEPEMKGAVPIPRDSHSCTTVGDRLFVFGGTDGRNPLRDLLILDTTSHTWISPSVRGDGPEAREGHSAALIGKRLFIFGGCGKYENYEMYYDDLYILNTETFVWKRVVPSGTPPSKRDSHTCSSWKNKIIVIGGEDSFDFYLSDVHILDADTLVWCKLNTAGQLLPPRAGHTTVAFGKYLFVFGGFSDEQNLYDDVYMLDVENGLWTKIMAIGEGPSARFSMAGEILDPHMQGVLVFIGGCDRNLEALDDLYYLHTGLVRLPDRDDRRIEKLSLRKLQKLKCQGQNPLACTNNDTFSRLDNNANLLHPIPVTTYIQPGKKTFEATVTKSFADSYTIETLIDGKPLRGVLFSNGPIISKETLDDSIRKMEAVKIDNSKAKDQNTTLDLRSSKEQIVEGVRQTDDPLNEDVVATESQSEPAAVEMTSPELSHASLPIETAVASNPSVKIDVNLESNVANGEPYSSNKTPEERVPAAKESVT